MPTYKTRNDKATIALAKRLARRMKGGEVILLQGELGAGKTTFVKGLAATLGIRNRIKSPTFTLMHVHRVGVRGLPTDQAGQVVGVRYFVHCDAYRVKKARELQDIGLMDYLGCPDTVAVIEWGEKIKPLLRGKKYIVIKFRHGKTEDERIITLTP